MEAYHREVLLILAVIRFISGAIATQPMIALKFCILLLSVLALQANCVTSISKLNSDPKIAAIEIKSSKQLDLLIETS